MFVVENLFSMVDCAKINVVCRVAFVDSFGDPEEYKNDKYAIETGADTICPVPAEVLMQSAPSS